MTAVTARACVDPDAVGSSALRSLVDINAVLDRGTQCLGRVHELGDRRIVRQGCSHLLCVCTDLPAMTSPVDSDARWTNLHVDVVLMCCAKARVPAIVGVDHKARATDVRGRVAICRTDAV